MPSTRKGSMSKAVQTPVEKFSHILDITLEAYADEVFILTQGVIDAIGKEGAKAVSANAKKAVHSRTYHKGWTYSSQRPKNHHKRETTGVIYNQTEYRLAHLLERSHVMSNGTNRNFGMSKAHPHIEPVEQEIIDKISDKLMRAIK